MSKKVAEDRRRWAQDPKQLSPWGGAGKKGPKEARRWPQDGLKKAQAGPRLAHFSSQTPRCGEIEASSVQRRPKIGKIGGVLRKGSENSPPRRN